MIIVCQTFLKNTKIAGIALFPFIFIRNKELLKNKSLINHEKIHIRQQLELLVVPFYILYFGEFLYNWMKYKNRSIAYYNISFEKEAYYNDQNLKYLQRRKFWNFTKYYR